MAGKLQARAGARKQDTSPTQAAAKKTAIVYEKSDAEPAKAEQGVSFSELSRPCQMVETQMRGLASQHIPEVSRSNGTRTSKLPTEANVLETHKNVEPIARSSLHFLDA